MNEFISTQIDQSYNFIHLFIPSDNIHFAKLTGIWNVNQARSNHLVQQLINWYNHMMQYREIIMPWTQNQIMHLRYVSLIYPWRFLSSRFPHNITRVVNDFVLISKYSEWFMNNDKKIVYFHLCIVIDTDNVSDGKNVD